MKKICFAFCLLLAMSPLVLRAQTAHAGASVVIGNNFQAPRQIAVDASGDIFIGSLGSGNVLEVVAINGQVSANSTVNVIGSGFNSPSGVAVDSYGNVYVADALNSQVKEIVAVNGQVSATSAVNIIGSGFARPIAVAVDSYGNVYVADSASSQVKEILAVNGQVSASSTVSTIASHFVGPLSVTVDHYGNLFVADYAVVYEIVAVNGRVSTASSMSAISSGFTTAAGVAVDSYGNVFATDEQGRNSVEKIVAVNGAVSANSSVQTVGNGYSYPWGVAVDGNGNVFASNGANGQLLETFSGSQKFPATAVGSVSAAQTVYFTFDSPGTLAATPYVVLTRGAQNLDFQAAPNQAANVCAAGNSYNAGDVCSVTVTFTPTQPYQRIGAVQLVGSSGTPIASYNLSGTGTGPQVIFPSNSAVNTLSSGFLNPYGVAVDAAGDVFVADPGTGTGGGSGWGRTGNTSCTSNCGSGGGITGNSISAQARIATAVTSSSAATTAAASGSPGVYEILAGSSTPIAIGSGFNTPSGTAVDGSGDVFVADPGSGSVYEIVAVNGAVSSSSVINTIGSNFITPTSVAVDGSGNVFVVDAGNVAVYEIVAVNGTVTANSVVDTIGSANGSFSDPIGVAVDNSGDVFVADAGNGAVYEIQAVNGVPNTNSPVFTVGSAAGLFKTPTGVSVDGGGNVYVADKGNNALYEILAANGSVSANSPVVSLGSGFNAPAGVAVDARGNLFIADSQNQAAKEIDRSDAPALTFASSYANVQSSASPQSVLFENNGNQALAAVSPGLVIGANFLQVAGSGTPADCAAGFALAPGQACNLSINFAPTVVGPIQSSATFTDNALNANPSVSQVILLSGTGLALIAPTVTFTGAPQSAPYQSSFVVSATTNSGATPSLLASGACSLNGNAVTMTSGTGTCQLSATWPQNGNYKGTSLSQTTAAQTIAPTDTFTGAPQSAAYQASFAVSTTTNSGVSPILSASGACSLNGTTVTMTSGAGTCSLQAVFAANSNYSGATLTQTTAAQTITPTDTFTGAPQSAAYQSSFLVATTTNSGVTPVLSAAGACSINGSTVTMSSGTGTCSLQAVFAATSNYSAKTLTQTTAAQTTAPADTFTGAPQSAAYQSSFVAATSTNSGVTPILSASGACSINGSTITMTSGTGTCSLQAVFAGNSNYSAKTLTQTTTALLARPSVTFTGAPVSALYQSTFTVSATTNSSAKAILSASGACTINGAVVTMTSGTGMCTLGATWTADSNFAAASLQQATTAAPAPQTVNIAAIANPTALKSYPLSATSTSNGTPAFTSSTPAICTVSGASVSLIGTGTCTLGATVPATSNYQKGSASYSFTVAPPFTIMAKSIITTVVRGTAAAFVLDVQSLGIFKGNVTLSCSGGPAGTICVDFPMTVPVNPMGVAVSGILVPKTATPGNYTVSFTGVSGALTAVTQATITVK